MTSHTFVPERKGVQGRRFKPLEEWVISHPEDLDGRTWLFKKLWTNLPHDLRRRLFWWLIVDLVTHG